MAMTRRIMLVTTFALLMILVGGGHLSAQDSEPPVEAPSRDADFRELYDGLKEKTDEFSSLRGQIAEATGEDREALAKLASELAAELVDDLEGLTDNVIAREKEGLDVAADRKTVADIYDGVSEHFQTMVDDLGTKMRALHEERENAAPEDLPAVTTRLAEANAYLDKALQILTTQVERREAFGLDATSQREYLNAALTDRAELLMGRIELTRDDLEILRARAKADPDNAEFAAETDEASSLQDLYVKRLELTSELMDKLGLETTDYQQLLFEVTGEITTGTMSRDVLAAIVGSWVDSAVGWLKTTAPKIFFKLVLFALILLVFRFLSKIARRVVRKAIRSSNLKFSQLLERTALSVTGGAVMFFGLLVALSQLGVEVAPLLAGLGVAGFIVGFALQDTLANFAAGFMILLYRPYDVGDLIETAGAFGKVENMTLVSTTLLTLDHQTLVIPNSKIWGDVIKNVTAQKIRRIDMVFGISYTDDIPHAESVLEDIVSKHQGVLESPEAVVKLHNLGESSVDFVVRPWVKTDDYWEIYWDITREVKMRFDAEGISIPFPQRDVHIIPEGPGESA